MSVDRWLWWSLPLAAVVPFYHRSLRVSMLLPEGRRIGLHEYVFGPVIFAHSERIDLAITAASLYARFILLVDPGRDGEKMASVLARIGNQIVRGSSLQSGSRALLRLVREMDGSPHPAAIAVDGPVGPLGSVKPGILLCARHSGRPIIPLGAAVRPRLVFRRSWTRMFLPLPFSRVEIALGEPMFIPRRGDRNQLENLRLELEYRIEQAQTRAERQINARLR